MHWSLNYKDVFPEQGMFFLQELENICCKIIISHLIIYLLEVHVHIVRRTGEGFNITV